MTSGAGPSGPRWIPWEPSSTLVGCDECIYTHNAHGYVRWNTLVLKNNATDSWHISGVSGSRNRNRYIGMKEITMGNLNSDGEKRKAPVLMSSLDRWRVPMERCLKIDLTCSLSATPSMTSCDTGTGPHLFSVIYCKKWTNIKKYYEILWVQGL